MSSNCCFLVYSVTGCCFLLLPHGLWKESGFMSKHQGCLTVQSKCVCVLCIICVLKAWMPAGGPFPGRYKWLGAVLGSDGCLYGIPYNAQKILKSFGGIAEGCRQFVIFLVFSAFNGGLEFPFSKLSVRISMNLPIQHDGGDWRSMMGRASTLLFVDPNIKSYQIYLDLFIYIHLLVNANDAFCIGPSILKIFTLEKHLKFIWSIPWFILSKGHVVVLCSCFANKDLTKQRRCGADRCPVER